MLDIVFSIPIHQRLEVVLDQIFNFLHFNPNCGLVLHFSQGFDYANSKITKEQFLRIIDKIGNIFVNPNSVRTGFADIIQAHLSNFEFISFNVDFEFFAICASNELFVRSGLYDLIKTTDCGFNTCCIEQANDWKYGHALFRDEALKSYLKKKNSSKIVFTTPEGQYYKKQIFCKIFEEIKSFYNYQEMKEAYPREEIYFPTILSNLKEQNIVRGEIFTYSAYHFAYLWDVCRLEVDKISKSSGNLFSVKRVDRELNNVIRSYLRDKYGYKMQLEAVLPNNIHLYKYGNITIDYHTYLKNIKQLLSNWKKIPKYFTNHWKT